MLTLYPTFHNMPFHLMSSVITFPCSLINFHHIPSRADISSNPPVLLTEPYYECTSTFYSALNNAIGIASGNTSTFFPLGVAFLLPLMYLYLKIIGYVPPKEEYTKDEKEEAINVLATNILRSRDGKTRAMTRNGAIVSLSKDLLKVAKEAPGYPDSDDEDSDDSDDDKESGMKPKSKIPIKASFEIDEGDVRSSKTSQSHGGYVKNPLANR